MLPQQLLSPKPPTEMGAGAQPEFTFVSPTVVVEATSAAGAIVNYPPATADGEIGNATISYSQNSGTLFPLGLTIVKVSAVDQGGNYLDPTFAVLVQDTTPPAFTSPVDLSGRGDQRGRGGRQLRAGDGDRRRRTRHDQLLEGVGQHLPAGDDHRHGERQGRCRQRLDAVVQGDGA